MMHQYGKDSLASDRLLLSHDQVNRLILDHTEESFILVNKEFRIINANQFAKVHIKETLGVAVYPGMSVLDLAPVYRHKELIALYEEVFKGCVKTSLVEIPKNGETLYFEVSYKPAQDNGIIVGALVTSRNITEKKKSEKILEEFEERWRYALEGTNHGVWDWNMETNHIFYSESYKKLYGFEEGEIDNDYSEWEKRVHPDDIAKMKDALAKHSKSKDPFYESLYRIKDKYHQYRWILGRGKIVSRKEDGTPIRMIGMHTDITNQKREEENYKLLFYDNPLPMWTCDLASHQMLDVNHATESLYGYSSLEFKSLLLSDIDLGQTRQSSLTDLVSSGKFRGVRCHRKKDGTIFYVELTANVVERENKRILLVLVNDITKRKYQEELLSLERFIFELSANPEVEFRVTIEQLLLGLENIHPEMYSSVIILNEDQTGNPYASPRLPSSLLRQMEGLNLGPEDGSSGAAIHQKKMIIIEDISDHPLCRKLKYLAEQYQWKACCSIPLIMSSGKVLGTLTIFYKKGKKPDQDELNTLTRITNILVILMENHWSLQEIRDMNERFDIMMQATHDLIWDLDLKTGKYFRNSEGLENVYGVKDNGEIDTIQKLLGRIHPDDQQKVEQVLDELVRSQDKNRFDLEYRFKRDDGSYSFVFDRGIILRDPFSIPIRMIGAAQDISERKRLENEILTNELLKQKAINQASIDTQEKERSEIGRELHDNVNQVLTTTKLYLELAMSNQELKDELIQKSSKNIMAAINEIRQLSRSLMDANINDLGIIDPLSDLISSINLTGKIKVNMIADESVNWVLNKNQQLMVYRIVQEALHNAIRHSNASILNLSFNIKNNFIELTIEDNGIGLDFAKVKKGAGLKNIENRVYLLQGTLTIQSQPQRGCTFIIKFPVA
jgi:PAS domain S-box-containing protein